MSKSLGFRNLKLALKGFLDGMGQNFIQLLKSLVCKNNSHTCVEDIFIIGSSLSKKYSPILCIPKHSAANEITMGLLSMGLLFM